MMDAIADSVTRLSQAALNIEQLRAQVDARNIANIDTSGYRPRIVDVAGYLAALRNDANVGGDHIRGETSMDAAKAWVRIGAAPLAVDSHRSLDQQVVDMAEAKTAYAAITESLNRHFLLYRLAIAGR